MEDKWNICVFVYLSCDYYRFFLMLSNFIRRLQLACSKAQRFQCCTRRFLNHHPFITCGITCRINTCGTSVPLLFASPFRNRLQLTNPLSFMNIQIFMHENLSFHIKDYFYHVFLTLVWWLQQTGAFANYYYQPFFQYAFLHESL